MLSLFSSQPSPLVDDDLGGPCFEMGSFYVARAVLEFAILLLLPPKHLGYRHVPLCPAEVFSLCPHLTVYSWNPPRLAHFRFLRRIEVNRSLTSHQAEQPRGCVTAAFTGLWRQVHVCWRITRMNILLLWEKKTQLLCNYSHRLFLG